MDEFEVHWDWVRGPVAAGQAARGLSLAAVWPVPVNPDECFAAAGCTTFGEHEDPWDERAEALLDRLLIALSQYGEPRLLSEPVREDLPWYARLFRTGAPLPIRQQLLEPIHWDSLPRGRVAFGHEGVELSAGDGHHLYWLVLPTSRETEWPGLLALAAGPWPVRQTKLRWEHLRVERTE